MKNLHSWLLSSLRTTCSARLQPRAVAAPHDSGRRGRGTRNTNGNPTKQIERTLTTEYAPLTYGKGLLNFRKNSLLYKTNHFSFARPVRFARPLTKINGTPAKRIVYESPPSSQKTTHPSKTNRPSFTPSPLRPSPLVTTNAAPYKTNTNPPPLCPPRHCAAISPAPRHSEQSPKPNELNKLYELSGVIRCRN
jgi:hypothetical protein